MSVAARPIAGEPGADRTTGTTRRRMTVRRLGRVDYLVAHVLQKQLVEARRTDEVADTLLLLEHPPVITLGARNRVAASHIVAGPEQLAREGVTVHETGRGGDVTYHGPGQLVAYPIFNLRPDRCDVHRYVRDLEEAIVLAIARFGIRGFRVDGRSGVWVGDEGREEKIAAIGIRVSRWITSHGLALNVSTNLEHFRLIVPCGIADRGVTSIQARIGRPVALTDVEDALVDGMARVFGADVVAA